jgi:DNA-3-methyladenine glycosylase II
METKASLVVLSACETQSSDMYLLMALLRPDVWPKGDLALAVAVQQVKRLRQRLAEEELSEISRDWEPWRSVAARLLWNYYLSCRADRAI